jgi:DNA-binding GntR family transcriptional regulator
MRTVVEKVVEYLMTHKKSSTVKQLAKYFIVSEGSVSRALCDLVKEQKVERIQTRGSPTSYRWIWRPASAAPKRNDFKGVELPIQDP